MEGDLDAVLRALHEVGSQLDVVGDDDPALRAELRRRQEALRAEARAIRDSVPENPGELRRRLEGLYAERAAILEMHVDQVRQAAGGEGRVRGFAADAQRLNKAIDEGAGRAELEERIRKLEQRLHALESG